MIFIVAGINLDRLVLSQSRIIQNLEIVLSSCSHCAITLWKKVLKLWKTMSVLIKLQFSLFARLDDDQVACRQRHELVMACHLLVKVHK